MDLGHILSQLLDPLQQTEDGRRATVKLYEACNDVMAAMQEVKVDWALQAAKCLPSLMAKLARGHLDLKVVVSA